MRATLNFEFGSEEIESFATNVVVKGIVGALGDVAGDPMQMQVLLAGLHQGIGMVLSHASSVIQQRPHGPPPWARGYTGPPPQGPYGPMGPMPSTGPGASASADPGNVRPIREPAVVVDRCFPIEATRNTEAGWACHGCATFNGSQRIICRYCSHTRCDAVATPPPERPSPPQVPESP